MTGKKPMSRAGRAARRLIQILVTLFGVSFLTFLLTYIAPGDPAEVMLTECGNVPTPELLAQTRTELGLDKPFLVQYGSWLNDVLHLDLGMSYSKKVPVADKLLECLGPSIALAASAFVLMLVISVPAGILAALFRDRWPDYLIRGATFFGVSIPSFWLGLILLSIFGVTLRWVPVAGGSDDWRSLVLPAVTLAFSMSAKYTRQVRTVVLDELGQDYVLGARMRGLPGHTILFRHILPNAMLPLITLMGLSIGSLLGGTAVVEVIFGWPGMGNLAVSAITAHDYPLVQAYVLFVALIYMVINLLVDLSYRHLDPRLKEAD